MGLGRPRVSYITVYIQKNQGTSLRLDLSNQEPFKLDCSYVLELSFILESNYSVVVLEKLLKAPKTVYLLLYTMLAKLTNAVFTHYSGSGKSQPYGHFSHIIFSDDFQSSTPDN